MHVCHLCFLYCLLIFFIDLACATTASFFLRPIEHQSNLPHRFLCLHLTVDPYLNKGLNEFQRLILFSQYLTIFGGIMFNWVESVDKLLEMEKTPSKRQERDIIAALIVAVNLVAIGIYPIYRMIMVSTGFKGGVLYFFLRDKVQNAMGGRVKETHSKAQFQGHSTTNKLLEKARQLGCPPEPISHSNHRGAPAPRPALLDISPVYISTREMMSAAGPPSESLSAAATTGAKYSGLAPTPSMRYEQISGQMVYKIGREESYRV